VCSVAPVFELKQVPTVLRDILGVEIDMGQVEKAVQKVKKTINLECNIHPLIDEDLLARQRAHEKEAKEANLKLAQEVRDEIASLDYKISVQLKDVAGTSSSYPEEVTLLTKVAL